MPVNLQNTCNNDITMVLRYFMTVSYRLNFLISPNAGT